MGQLSIGLGPAPSDVRQIASLAACGVQEINGMRVTYSRRPGIPVRLISHQIIVVSTPYTNTPL